MQRFQFANACMRVGQLDAESFGFGIAFAVAFEQRRQAILPVPEFRFELGNTRIPNFELRLGADTPGRIVIADDPFR